MKPILTKEQIIKSGMDYATTRGYIIEYAFFNGYSNESIIELQNTYSLDGMLFIIDKYKKNDTI